MKCPTCTTVNLVMSERQGIEIDYCPECRGVWLDRGELDKIIARASEPPDSRPHQPAAAPPAATLPASGTGLQPGSRISTWPRPEAVPEKVTPGRAV